MLIVTLGCWLAVPSPAGAITAGDVMDKMTEPEAAEYTAGAIDMAMYLYGKNGDDAKAKCILNWFYQDNTSAKEVVAVFNNYKDKPAIGLLHVLIDRHCK